MNYNEANEMMEAIVATGMHGVSVDHIGFWLRSDLPKIENDGKWCVRIKCSNSKTGTMQSTEILTFDPSAKNVKEIAKKFGMKVKADNARAKKLSAAAKELGL
jgi:hypothetical protein